MDAAVLEKILLAANLESRTPHAAFREEPHTPDS